MAATSAIEWTNATWNPITGCDKVSPGCAHCYAETFAERLELPLTWRKPRMIFVNSMSDLFHERVPLDFIERVFDTMQRATQHTFQILTKRHERLAEIAPSLAWPENVWMGVSIENKRWVRRAHYLRAVPSAVRFISAEPLLGKLEGLDLTGIDWLIAGGESGPRYRPVNVEWVRDLRDRCGEQRVAFFFKQWGGIRSKAGGRTLDDREWSDMPVAVAR